MTKIGAIPKIVFLRYAGYGNSQASPCTASLSAAKRDLDFTRLDATAFAAMGLERGRVHLLVHSGSRGLGEAVLRAHTERHGAAALI